MQEFDILYLQRKLTDITHIPLPIGHCSKFDWALDHKQNLEEPILQSSQFLTTMQVNH